MALMEAAANRARTGGAAAGPDRLSALTDDLLHHVLSSLPSRQAVRTSVLSKRWTDLWRSVPAINLNIYEFGDSGDDERERWRKMEDFTTNLLMRHRAAGLNLFRLYICPLVDCHRDAHRWIRRATEYGVSVLDVQLRHRYTSLNRLPHLGSRHLKTLRLHWVSLDQSFAEQLCSGCPVLEDLALYMCCTEFGGIRSDSLKNLTVDYCQSSVADKLVIRAPCLASLSLGLPMDSYRNGASLEAGNSLVEASISVSHGQFRPRIEAMLLGIVFNVKTLELEYFSAMAMLDKELDKFPMFDNLTTLSLIHCLEGNCDGHKFNALGRFLQRCPKLKNLTLCRLEVVPFAGPVKFPMLENLRTLSLEYCDLHDNFQLLRRCLRSSPNLENLTVHRCNF